MIAHTAKVMPILSSVLVLIGFFLTSCVGINLGDIPRGLRHPRDVPSVDPSTLGRKTLYALASLKYCYITFAIWAIIPRGGHSYTKTPHGMFCLYGK